MTNQEKILQLKNKIITTLKDEIGSKVILLDCPYHGNIGDILIWEGEIDFFKITNRKVLFQHSLFTYSFPDVPHDITICLHGGGNFGDLYRAAQDFRIDVINRYPNNKIVIFPQSVFYENNDLIERDALAFSQHKNLIVCARDKESYLFLQNNFKGCKIKLMPDMAFCIDTTKFEIKKTNNEIEKSVYFKRLDKEVVDRQNVFLNTLEHRDWVPFEKKCHWSFVLMRIGYRSMNIKNKLAKGLVSRFLDFFMQKFAKSRLIKSGIATICPFNNIYTTRLHAMILGVLMHKNTYGIDSKTRKIRDFYNTWLIDCESAEIYDV